MAISNIAKMMVKGFVRKVQLSFDDEIPVREDLWSNESPKVKE